MKERIQHDGEFEKQLKDKADQFKMYPSDKVWNDVYSSLHTRRRRFVAGMSVLIGGILIFAGAQLIFPSRPVLSKNTAVHASSVKPATGTAMPSFTAVDLVSAGSVNAADKKSQAGTQIQSNPYIAFATTSIDLNNSGNFSDNLSEKNISNPHSRTSQPESPDVAKQAGDLRTGSQEPLENQNALQNVVDGSLVAADLSTEKSASQPSHLRNDRFSWEIYITPTLNTHYLSGINYQNIGQSLQSAPIMLVNVSNVNGFVDNTPVLGYNVGGNILYKLSRNFSLKAGVEFSYNRYYIKAYNSNSSQTSVALNSYFGYISNPMNTMPGSPGPEKNPQQYQNRYYQLSLPIGIEMKAAGSGRVQLHLGASLQPSYLLNTDAYVLSDDYKGYVKDPQAFRRWNLNVGAEAYISYGVGNIRWELGPQVRYQFFSTYKNSYPLKENILNYGIRIGISKTIW
jgi:hypothetical protein